MENLNLRSGYLYMYMYVHLYTCTRTCTYVYLHVYLYLCTCMIHDTCMWYVYTCKQDFTKFKLLILPHKKCTTPTCTCMYVDLLPVPHLHAAQFFKRCLQYLSRQFNHFIGCRVRDTNATRFSKRFTGNQCHSLFQQPQTHVRR